MLHHLSLGGLLYLGLPTNWKCARQEAADRHPDLPQASRGRLLLRRQDRLHPPLDARRHPLLPVAPAPLRQEPAARHHQGTVRGQRGTVPRPVRARPLGVVQAPPGGAPRLRRRRLPRPGPAGSQRHGAARCHRAARRYHPRVPHGPGSAGLPAGSAARAVRAAGGGAGRRVRQADPGRAGTQGDGARQPPLPARAVRDHQDLRRVHRVHAADRGEQVLQGQRLLRPQQSQGHHPVAALLGDLRLHRGRPGHGVRAGVGRAGPQPDPRLVQRL